MQHQTLLDSGARHFLGLALVAALLVPAASLQAALPAVVDGDELPTLAPMLEEVTPAVVNISTEGTVRMRENPLFQDPFFRRFFDMPQQPRERRSQSLGSGVIIDADEGLVVTNNHVIAKADEITVTLHDGRSLNAEVVGSDPESDVALIRIPAEDLKQIRIADSDSLRVGDFVVAIGNPFGLNQTVTSGIVSGLSRSGLGIEGYEDFIQTDASINPGNSGGALVNLRGELVGINTAILAPSGGNVGIGFAIPANMVTRLTDQIVEYGEVRRGRLGVYIQDLTADLARALDINVDSGAVVSKVIPGSPAEQAGVHEGDVITAVNGNQVESAADLRNAVGLLRAGESLDLVLNRDGERIEIDDVVTEANIAASGDGDTLSSQLRGATLRTVEGDAEGEGGVEVVEVEPGSEAASAGLREGDIIISANRRRVPTLEDLREAIGSGNGPLLLNIRRGEGALFLVLR